MRRPGCAAQRGAGVGAPNRQREPVDDLVGNAIALGDPIEGRILVEPAEVRDPFDDLARASDRQEVPLAHDRRRLEIDAGRIVSIDGDLRLAGLAPLVERREIHEWKPDRPLDLVDVGTGEEHHGSRGVDAPDSLSQAVRTRIGKKPEHRLLQLDRLIHASSLGMLRLRRADSQSVKPYIVLHLSWRFRRRAGLEWPQAATV